MWQLRAVLALLVALTTCLSPAPRLGAQAASPTAPGNAAHVQRRVAKAPVRPVQARRDTGADKSLSQTLFDTGWVLFPARLALVIVFLTIAMLLLMFGTWSTVRVAHSLRHTRWSQPPRRLKRGEVGAAGTSFAVEWEERMHENLEQDAARDRQIVALHETVARLSKEHAAMAAAVDALLQRNPEIDGNEAEFQG
jgi:HAMP domain-containing protein